MKVKIGPYKSWFGPYQLAELLMFWVPKETDEHGFKHTAKRVHKFGEWLAHGKVLPDPKVGESSNIFADRKNTWLHKLLLWIDSKTERKVYVHIDRYDTWSMDHTLAYIILPMLKQLQKSKHGSPFVDDEDVPEELRSTSAPPKENEWDTDDNFHKRWDYVLNEIIFAFETKVGELKDWDEQFRKGDPDIDLVKQEDGNFLMVKPEDSDYEYDHEGAKEYQKRISNGFRLFGKYYEGLWD
jgi:hypothetical protein